jgi:hypothetical protein
MVLTGGELWLGTPDGLLVGLDGPTGQVSDFSASAGRLVVTAGASAFVSGEIDRTGSTEPTWRAVELALTDGRRARSAPILSPDARKIALVATDRGTTASLEVVVVDLGSGDATVTPLRRESNGPPVWIDKSSLLLEVLPIPGGTRFLQMNLGTGGLEPESADGFGPSISADGSRVAVGSNDGSVLALPASDWLAGTAPDEGAVVDSSVTPFQLSVDATGSRIAVGYADEAGDPASVAVFVRTDGGWRQTITRAKVVSGSVTMLGWLN